MTAARRSRRAQERGAGFLTRFLGAVFIVIGFTSLLDVADAPAWVWLATGSAGLWWWAREATRRRRERAAARAKARAQRLLLWGIGARRHAERPIAADSPLPRAWWEPVSLAHRAVEDYRFCVGGLPGGPVRQRMLDGVPAMEAGAEQLEALARRGAELDRQLRQVRSTGGWVPQGSAGDGSDTPQQRIARMTSRVETVRHRVGTRLEALRLAALEAADVAVSLSLSDADELVSGVEDALTRVSGLVAAIEEADAPARRPQGGRQQQARPPRRPSPAGAAASTSMRQPQRRRG